MAQVQLGRHVLINLRREEGREGGREGGREEEKEGGKERGKRKGMQFVIQEGANSPVTYTYMCVCM